MNRTMFRFFAAVLLSLFLSSAAHGYTNQQSDCLFNWVESNYSLYFPRGPQSQEWNSYYYRYYSQTGLYLFTYNGHLYYQYYGAYWSSDQGDVQNWYQYVGCGIRPVYPVIFIPGIMGGADTWNKFGIYLQPGGTPTVRAGSVSNIPAGNFYRVVFSSNNMLTFEGQGRELATIIARVKAANKNVAKVILVGHSMGGLAARAYLQGSSYGQDVAKLITIGTPHLGSRWATTCLDNSIFNIVLYSVCTALFGDNPSASVALQGLKPDTNNELRSLNSKSGLLPPISYTSIVVSSHSDFGGTGDGIVYAESQDLGSLALPASITSHSLNKRVMIQINPFSLPASCSNYWYESHTCEPDTDFTRVRDAIMSELQAIP